jgi:hypothetical protein
MHGLLRLSCYVIVKGAYGDLSLLLMAVVHSTNGFTSLPSKVIDDVREERKWLHQVWKII